MKSVRSNNSEFKIWKVYTITLQRYIDKTSSIWVSFPFFYFNENEDLDLKTILDLNSSQPSRFLLNVNIAA